MAVYSPSVMQWYDAPRFARTGEWAGFFSDYWTPAGYPALLWLLRVVSHDLAFTIGVQHLLGLVTGLILAATAHRAGVRSPWHLVAGAAVFFGGDFLYLEHLVMTESIMLFLIAGGVYADRQSVGRGPPVCLAGRRVRLAGRCRARALERLCAHPWPPRGRRATCRACSRRVTHVLAATAPFVVAVVVYGLASTAVGTYSGIDDMRGWHLYGRVAPFLDCRQTTADDRFPGLCEGTPPGARPGPFFYTWDVTSPARSLWGLDPARAMTCSRWASTPCSTSPSVRPGGWSRSRTPRGSEPPDARLQRSTPLDP